MPHHLSASENDPNAAVHSDPMPVEPTGTELINPAAPVLRTASPGYVLLAALDTNGNEIPGSHFSISEAGYLRSFSDETKFKVIQKTELIYHETNTNRSYKPAQRGGCSSC